jgi:hypothetical protein
MQYDMSGARVRQERMMIPRSERSNRRGSYIREIQDLPRQAPPQRVLQCCLQRPSPSQRLSEKTARHVVLVRRVVVKLAAVAV